METHKSKRHEVLEKAIQTGELFIFKERIVGLPCQLSRIAGVAQSTVRYSYTVGSVRKYEVEGQVLAVDAEDFVEYLRTVRRGRKKLLEN